MSALELLFLFFNIPLIFFLSGSNGLGLDIFDLDSQGTSGDFGGGMAVLISSSFIVP